jgi:hypothetical protein
LAVYDKFDGRWMALDRNSSVGTMIRFEDTGATIHSASEGETQHVDGRISIVVRGSTSAGSDSRNVVVTQQRSDAATAPSTTPGPVGSTHIWFPEEIARKSLYVSTLLDSGMVEARSKRVDLTHLDPRAVEIILRFLHDPDSEFDSLLERQWEAEEVDFLAEAFDYLQVEGSDGLREMLLSLRAIRSQCIRQGWVDKDNPNVFSFPSARKKRYWRFWVCFLLCRNILPVADSPVEQGAFTATLQVFGGDSGDGTITLRRELVDYGLIAREGDGSAYWRPKYTASMMSKWLVGIPRSIV